MFVTLEDPYFKLWFTNLIWTQIKLLQIHLTNGFTFVFSNCTLQTKNYNSHLYAILLHTWSLLLHRLQRFIMRCWENYNVAVISVLLAWKFKNKCLGKKRMNMTPFTAYHLQVYSLHFSSLKKIKIKLQGSYQPTQSVKSQK